MLVLNEELIKITIVIIKVQDVIGTVFILDVAVIQIFVTNLITVLTSVLSLLYFVYLSKHTYIVIRQCVSS